MAVSTISFQFLPTYQTVLTEVELGDVGEEGEVGGHAGGSRVVVVMVVEDVEGDFVVDDEGDG